MKYNLVFVIDEKKDYARHLGATLISVLENSKKQWNIFIIHNKLTSQSRDKIKYITDKYKAKLEFIKLDQKQISIATNKGTRFSSIVYGRLFTPYLLKDKEKAIYLDCDIIVKKPLEELYDIDLEKSSIGAIPDGVKDQISSKTRLKMTESKIYFNSGVILMDLNRLRENDLFQKVIELSLERGDEFELPDQDALNIIFQNKFKVLDIKWNYTHGNSEENALKLNEIGIIHFTGDIKPWDCRNYSPYRSEYWSYLNKTPWKGYKSENCNFKNIMLRELIKLKLNSRKSRYILKKIIKKDREIS